LEKEEEEKEEEEEEGGGGGGGGEEHEFIYTNLSSLWGTAWHLHLLCDLVRVMYVQ
jgi:hypothetical protein